MNKIKPIYCINRYQTLKLKKIKEYSGYEQIIKYSEIFKVVQINPKYSRILVSKTGIKLPVNYFKSTLGEEFVLLIKSLIFRVPIFYLYADKDAFLIPLIKRKLSLKRLKIYGTLHWPIENSKEFSFYKYNLATQFNGIITLSKSLQQNFTNGIVIPHGIDLKFWRSEAIHSYKNTYLILGQSNRNHTEQINVINKIKDIDSDSRFILLSKKRSIYEQYENIERLNIIKRKITDLELKHLYEEAKGVILIQEHSLASNVVLECIAMSVPLIANDVGDVTEYVGHNYPLFLKESNENILKFCKDEIFRKEIVIFLGEQRKRFEWLNIAERTIEFIKKNH